MEKNYRLGMMGSYAISFKHLLALHRLVGLDSLIHAWPGHHGEMTAAMP